MSLHLSDQARNYERSTCPSKIDSIMLLESSTDSLIFIPTDERMKQLMKGDEDPNVFWRCPKDLGMIGIVIEKNKIFHSNYFVEAMNTDSDLCKQKHFDETNNPCSVIWAPIVWELFPYPIGAIQFVDKINSKGITEEDIGRVKALANLLGSLMSNICFISENFRNFFEIRKDVKPVMKTVERLYNIFLNGNSYD